MTTQPPIQPQRTVDDALSEGSYQGLRESKNENRLQLDGVWHQISPNWLKVQILSDLIGVVLVLAAAAAAWYFFDLTWTWIAGVVVLIPFIVALFILPRQAKAYGYMLRSDDIVFRRGILWQRFVAVPYGRMQLIDVTHGPLDRAFGIAQLKLVTAASTTNLQIPGLTQAGAQELRDVLITVAESRRTGL